MILQILLFFLVLSILVIVHELGHFLAAIKAGVKVEEFGFGIPPRIWGKKIGETLYSVNALPFGGFVRLHGENSEEGVVDKKRSFIHKGKFARISIIVAGVLMNFILAVVCFSLTYSITGVPKETGVVKVLEVASGSPASEAGIKEGDLLLTIDGVDVTTNTTFIDSMQAKKGDEVLLTIKNSEGDVVSLPPVLIRSNPPENQGPLGVVISSSENYFAPIWQRPFWGVYFGFKEAIFWGGVVLAGFAKIFADLFAGSVPTDLAGPVGIYALTSQAASFGILSVVNFIGVLSVNLAILNIMPFPALDGGRLFFVLVESIIGKKVLPKFEAVAHTLGMALLLLLLFAITAYDIKRLISAGSVEQFFLNISQQK